MNATLRLPPEAVRVDADGTDSAKTMGRQAGRGANLRRLAAQSAIGPNEFTKLVERTVDSLRGTVTDASYEDVQKILADIRKQYDDVHCEADRREQELLEVRRDIHLLEAASQPVPDMCNGMTRETMLSRMERASAEIDEAVETKQVYQHMVARLKRELKLVQHKVNIMEDHLRRKTTEVQRRQDYSRRVHKEKVTCINRLEAMEQEIEVERAVCGNALVDLEAASKMRQDEVRHREDFERWRYEIAMEAANEAFQVTAGRYWKIYAVEKLTGNCLQKITFEQLERSQMTEDGFQKIREVTGLTDVMDIVHKFLNRDVEHEQLKSAVHEAEVRLHNLREAEASRQGEGTTFELQDDITKPRGLYVAVSEHEQQLAKAVRDKEVLQQRLRRSDLLFDSIKQWARRMTKSLESVEDMGPVETPNDMLPFFEALSKVISRFLTNAHNEMPSTKLAKLTSQASGKEYAEQQRLLTDKEFMRMNCRVPATLDVHRHPEESKRSRGGQAHDDERQEQEFHTERERMKLESKKQAREVPVRERDAHTRQRHSARPSARAEPRESPADPSLKALPAVEGAEAHAGERRRSSGHLGRELSAG
mmetsp:Transcript_68940/g.213858  ORF Transcript_68940/g.213858 Transcript_68940/m.213858 type:complete len:593 (-) Transcript_68940:102-1880(-)